MKTLTLALALLLATAGVARAQDAQGAPPPAPTPIKPPPAPNPGKAATEATAAADKAAAEKAAAEKAAATPPEKALEIDHPNPVAETPAPSAPTQPGEGTGGGLAVPPAPVGPPPGLLEEDRPSNLRIAAWTSVAATVALLTAGAICGLAAQERADEITRQQSAVDGMMQPSPFSADLESRFKDLRSEGQSFNAAAIGLMAASGATAIVAATLFVLDRGSGKGKSDAGRVQLLPSLGPLGGGLSASFRF